MPGMWHGYEFGDVVGYADTQMKKVKGKRNKVQVTEQVKGRIVGFGKIGEREIAEVEVGALFGGGMKFVALKNIGDIKHELTDQNFGPDADGVNRLWKKGDLVKLDTPNCEQSHGQICTIRCCTVKVQVMGPDTPAERILALILDELSWAPSTECRPYTSPEKADAVH